MSACNWAEGSLRGLEQPPRPGHTHRSGLHKYSTCRNWQRAEDKCSPGQVPAAPSSRYQTPFIGSCRLFLLFLFSNVSSRRPSQTFWSKIWNEHTTVTARRSPKKNERPKLERRVRPLLLERTHVSFLLPRVSHQKLTPLCLSRPKLTLQQKEINVTENPYFLQISLY